MPLCNDDIERHEFLMELDNAPFTVTTWEAKFIDSNYDTFVFTPNQREQIDKMKEKYAARLSQR